jgi:hypothetical protein
MIYNNCYNFLLMLKLLLIVLVIAGTLQVKLIRKLNFKNQCKDTVWVGGFAVPLPPSSGWDETWYHLLHAC